jgi:hypothetical protein
MQITIESHRRECRIDHDRLDHAAAIAGLVPDEDEQRTAGCRRFPGQIVRPVGPGRSLPERGDEEQRRREEMAVCYNTRVLERLTIDDFTPLAGTVFAVQMPRIDLRLTRAGAVMESERAKLKRQPFSLYFEGPAGTPLPQSTYILSHDAFPEPLEIFLVPIGRTAEAYQYEAVFT